ncbi:BTAD domain-containing putative transcriptional regulator [Pseudactinotalea terrae]|uniref:BTAD domain-containing putative transcriptional regulator n=1 Tax=Pseudactinotalea terrae TaxID=1743262 RepID=UPI0012E213C5|nr:BTAD domain-containing putative transcriptional regulator [Pseudactinotalea terrae]
MSDERGPVPAQALRRRAHRQHYGGRFAEALDTYARADEENGDPASLSDVGRLVEAARIRAGQSSSHWARGEVAAAAALAEESRELAERCGDHAALADAHVAIALVCAAVGDRSGNAHAYDVALAHAAASGERDTTLRILTNVGSQLNEEGHHAAAVVRLEQALTLIAGAAGSDETALLAPLAHQNLGEAYLGQARIEEALHEFGLAEAGWLQADAPMRAHALLGMGEANRRQGVPTRAAAAYRDAVAIAEVTGSAQVLVPALAGLSRTLVEDAPEGAQQALSRCLATPAALGDVSARLAAGWLAFHADDLEHALQHAREAQAEAGRRRDPAGLAEALQLHSLLDPGRASARLAEARELLMSVGDPIDSAINALMVARNGRDRDGERDARRRLHALGVSDGVTRIAGPLRALGPTPTAEIQIRVLGHLAVLRRGRPLPVWSWQSRKCRDVVRILAAHPRGIGREALAELLWPGDPGVGARLSVVLSTLRTLLNPDRSGTGALVADRSTVRFDLDRVEIDAVELERRATAALRMVSDPRSRIAALEEVVAGYTGAFAEDEPYADWAAPVRARLAALADEVRRRLADELLELGRPAAAVSWYLGLVAADPYDEPSRRGLLRALHADRRHGQVRRYYADYCAAMAELDVPPVPLAALLEPPPATARRGT